MKILLDVMGGDNAPDVFIKGAVNTINQLNKDTQIILIGNEELIKERIQTIYKKELNSISDRILIQNATEVITNHELPVEALKTKKDSSLNVAFKMLKENEGDAFISCGSTGAFMAGGLLKVGRIKGIDRPALCPMLPTKDRVGIALLDAGANTNCKPINLLQFAKMGSIYVERTLGIKSPVVGLLNIGEESEKGNQLTKEAFELLKVDSTINFGGNLEARYMFDGNFRVAVADGFSGNIALKTAEGIGRTIKQILTQEFKKGLVRTMGAGILKATGAIDAVGNVLDYHKYGGALLLGVEKTMIKGHGSSKENDVQIFLKQAENFVNSKVVDGIKESLKQEKLT